MSEKQKSRVSSESPALLPHKEEKGVFVVYLPTELLVKTIAKRGYMLAIEKDVIRMI